MISLRYDALYISQIILSIGIIPIVRLKKSSSIACADTERKVGSSKSSLPNLRAPKEAPLSRCPKVHCALSLSRATEAGSLSRLPGLGELELLVLRPLDTGSLSSPALKSTIALMQANSCWSRFIALNPARVSRKRVTSIISSIFWGGSKGAGSKVGSICAAARRKSSRQEDSSNVSWSSMTRFVFAAKFRAQWTFKNSNLAACSHTDSDVRGGIIGIVCKFGGI